MNKKQSDEITIDCTKLSFEIINLLNNNSLISNYIVITLLKNILKEELLKIGNHEIINEIDTVIIAEQEEFNGLINKMRKK
jgi:hypothetical protein